MCNCGNKRESFSAQPSLKLSSGQPVARQGNKMWPDVSFEYTGKTALSVRGPISGKNYRFAKPGDTQLIDYRDASSMLGVPVLRRLK